VTILELRAFLARVDARQLREDAGISVATVARALGVTTGHIWHWEAGTYYLPQCPGGFRWVAFTRGLERRARVTAEIERECRDAALGCRRERVPALACSRLPGEGCAGPGRGELHVPA
jgi:hypothetical protein